MDKMTLLNQKNILAQRYKYFKDKNLKLDMSRGRPCKEQLDLSCELLNQITSTSSFNLECGIDIRNYGVLDGIPEIKKLFAEILQANPENIIVGGNSSLNMMFDTISCLFIQGINGCEPWHKKDKVKFLCPVPGYDRHFSILDYFGIEPINIPMLETGPNMDIVEKIISKDESVKGIWCVPKYSNPQGITYSDEIVNRFAKLRPLARDFRILWDNAYAVHNLYQEENHLLNIIEECKIQNNDDLPIVFGSTSKITLPGAGVGALAASPNNITMLKKHYSTQTIGFDKINQLRHSLFLKNINVLKHHMEKHRKIIAPKFDTVVSILETEMNGMGICRWTKPSGGYFISVDIMPGCAKEVVCMCKEAGVIITSAGATYPHGIDPKDSNIRIAPTCPSLDELKTAMELFCTSIKLVVISKIEKDELSL